MTARRLWILLLAALVVIGIAVWLGNQRGGSRAGVDEKVLPGLLAQLNTISEVHIVTAGDKQAVSLQKDGEVWRVAQREGYPADATRLRKFLIDLAQLDVVEEKTAEPANYAKLGVEELKAASATGARIDLTGLPKPTALIVGKSAAGAGSYVRPANSPVSLLAKPALTVEREPQNWVERAIVDFPAERVQQVRVSLPGARPYTATRTDREQSEFTVEGLPRGKKLSSAAAVNPLTGALAGLSLEDVRRAKPDEDWGAQAASVQYQLFDGTTVTVTGYKDDEQHTIRLAIGFDEKLYERFKPAPPAPAEEPAADAAKKDAPRSADEVRSDVQAAATKVDGWLYEIPAYKYETLFQPLEDLLSDP